MVPIRVCFLAVAIVALIGGSQGANILGIFPSLSPSHLIIQMSAAKVLAERGHNVTVVTLLRPVVTHKNITVITVPVSKDADQLMSDNVKEMAKNDNSNFVLALFRMWEKMDFIFKAVAEALKHDRVRDLYRNKANKFDLVLSGFFMSDFHLGFARKVNAPVIIVATILPNQMLNPLIGNPSEVSYVPPFSDSIEKGKSVSFRQRLVSFTTSFFLGLYMRFSDRRSQNLYEELFADDLNMPEYSEMLKNISLVFFASHALSEGPIRPNVPAAIEIGGIHIKDKPDPLPQNLADFLGNATDGAILLSLGSNMKGSYIRPDTVTKMFNVLSKLKQRVIWKWEDLEQTPGQSDNILYSKWLPQDDILAHPKIKLFINHAGKGGITEAQYHGKPMLSLPLFGDQPGNAEGMVKKGFGLTLSLLTLEEQPFQEAIQKILTNPQYAQEVATFSSLYRDRPMSSRELVVYWSEYVIRHHGAAHLQSPLVHMNFIAANNLDIYALLAGILVIVLLFFKALVKFIYRRFLSKPKKASKQKTH
ncbi:hypothetical protein KR059_007142 [Drosophila kikkawai]|nr:hypothetical protein KR059_007142 [Drosophila kikkawai]